MFGCLSAMSVPSHSLDSSMESRPHAEAAYASSRTEPQHRRLPRSGMKDAAARLRWGMEVGRSASGAAVEVDVRTRRPGRCHPRMDDDAMSTSGASLHHGGLVVARDVRW